jgi:signal transduction histidine kinase
VEPDLPRVSTDADRLRQVINNLIDNAIKFTDKGSIRVSARRIDGEVRIAVRDSGVGIPPEDLDKIFERFHQGGTVTTGKPRGIGLGLSICREIVRRSGGRIWAESAPGGGSTFIVALPAAAPAAPAREPRPEAVASAG